MAIQLQGNGGTIGEVDGTGFRALRTTLRPTDHGSLGHYGYGGLTGVLPAALAANSEIFQFRWTDATRLCVINEITISACVSTTFFAAGVPVQIDLVKSNVWSAAGSGGTAVSPAALLKKRTSMGSSLVASGDIRIATTAALGAGTKTLEGAALCALVGFGPTAAPGQIIAPGTTLLRNFPGEEHPLVLAQNEGFSIRSVAVPATGTWQATIQIDWTEVAAY